MKNTTSKRINKLGVISEVTHQDVIKYMNENHAKVNHSAIHDFLATTDKKIYQNDLYFFKEKCVFGRDLRFWKKSQRVSEAFIK